MKQIKIRVFVILTVCSICLLCGLMMNNQQPLYISSASSRTDEDVIKAIMDDLVQGVRCQNINRIKKYFSFSPKQISLGTIKEIEKINALLNQSTIKTHTLCSLREFTISDLGVSIMGDSAIVTLSLSTTTYQKIQRINLYFLKTQNQWLISDASSLSNYLEIIVGNQGGNQINQQSVTEKKRVLNNITSVNLSNHILVPLRWFPDQPTKWNITKTDAQNQYQASVLYDPIESERVPINSSTNAVFILDRTWRRIIYGSDNDLKLRSYGDHAGDYNFSEPRSIKVKKLLNGEVLVFVTDIMFKNVVKMSYNTTTNVLSYQTSYTTSLDQPIDIDWQFYDQSLWIADKGNGAIIHLDNNGNLITSINSYTFDGQTYPLNKPIKVIVGAWGIGFIDQEENAFVTVAYWDVQTNSNATSMSKFTNSSSALNSVGYIFGKEFVVTDNGLNMIHKFTEDGFYLGSFSTFNSSASSNQAIFNSINGIPLFNEVVSFGSDNYANVEQVQLESFSLQPWTNSSGFQRFLPGADILSYTASITSSYVNFDYVVTNHSIFSSKIYNSNNQVVLDFAPSITDVYAGQRVDQVNLSSLGSGVFTHKVSVQPIENPGYNANYQQNPIEKTFLFITAAPTLSSPSYGATCLSTSPTLSWDNLNGAPSYNVEISTNSSFSNIVYSGSSVTNSKQVGTLNQSTEYYWHVNAGYTGGTGPWSETRKFTTAGYHLSISGPSSLSTGESGTWTATLDCGSGNYSCTWYEINESDVGRVLGSVTTIVKDTMKTLSFTLRCTLIDNSVGLTFENTYNVAYTPPPSCPFVYTWDGNKFQEDNNILPQSEYKGNEGNDVTDYYRLLKPMEKKYGNYLLQIREYEHERSCFDNFRLLAVDHPVNTKIDVASDGSILQYRTPKRLQRAHFHGGEVTDKLLAFDSLNVSVHAGDTLSLDLSDSTLDMKGARTVFQTAGGGEGGGEGLPKIEKIATIVSPRTTSGHPATFTFRQRSTLVFVPMDVSNLRDWKLTWDANARLDYFNYGVIDNSPYRVRNLTLLSATHSESRSVLTELAQIDSSYATLNPGQSIQLRFAGVGTPLQGKKRTFILVSRGRYEKIADSTNTKLSPDLEMKKEITEFKLNANYPNPFNPVTTISFETPVDGHVLVAIYDMLGREVARLMDGSVTQGSYTLQWNADNDAASGLYFCRYSVTGNRGKEMYLSIQKILLMR